MSVHRYWANGIFHEFIDGVLRRHVPKGDGFARDWHANGVLAKELNRVKGVVSGRVLEWHDNGQLAREMPYAGGEVDGVVKQWNREGKLLGKYEMKMGRGIQRKWNEDGSLESELEKISENGYRGVIWDDLGKPHETFLWNGKPISRRKFFDKLAKAQADEANATS